MNILAIGNSFSQDATRYLHDIARKRGAKLDVANLYIGGCPLEKHFRNMLSGERAYELHYNGHETGFSVSLKEALLNREWDIITIQQASHFSFKKETYVPYAETLVEYVRSCAPKAKVFMHETWAYEDGSARLRDVAGYDKAEDMLRDIKTAYHETAEELELDGFIPSGEMLFKLTESGIPKIHRDTFHASLGLGRYALALLWYHVITGENVKNDTFCDLDEYASDAELAVARECVESF